MMKKPKKLTPKDIMKYEIAAELGLIEKIADNGWKSLTAKESGRIGGLMAKRIKTSPIEPRAQLDKHSDMEDNQ